MGFKTDRQKGTISFSMAALSAVQQTPECLLSLRVLPWEEERAVRLVVCASKTYRKGIYTVYKALLLQVPHSLFFFLNERRTIQDKINKYTVKDTIFAEIRQSSSSENVCLACEVLC